MAKWGKTTAVLTAALLMAAPAYADSEYEQIFHVYSGTSYVGAVKDNEKVEQLIESKVMEAEEAFGELHFVTDGLFTLIPEQVIASQPTDDASVLRQLNEAIELQAEAVQLSVDGHAAVYVEDREAYENVLRELKISFVSEKELEEYEESLKDTAEPAALAEGETRIKSLHIKADLSGSEELVDPERIVSVEEAAEILRSGDFTYTSADGDTLQSIAEVYGVQPEELAELNPHVKEPLETGTKLDVSDFFNPVTVEVVKEVRETETIPFWTVEQADESLETGKTKVVQKGRDGKADVVLEVQEESGTVLRKRVLKEQIITEPVTEQVAYGTKELPVIEEIPEYETAEEAFIWPAEGGIITSRMGERWGEFHRGIDIARTGDSSIKAANYGVVAAAGWQGTYGNRVIIEHRNGYRTLYAHLSSITVKTGDEVSQGEEVGIIGTTGRSTGIHLHFEVIKAGKNVNPLDYVTP